jgi:general nucleoside transport system permease protein
VRRRTAALVPFIAILSGFALGALVVIVTGRSPGDMFRAMLQGATGVNLRAGSINPRYLGEFLVQAMPIVLTGLSVGFAFRTGLFNIGAEGQLIAGSMAAIAVGLGVRAPAGLHVALAMLAAMAAGGLWGAIPGWLKARFNVHEVVVSIMLNYVALHLNNWAIVEVFHSPDRIKTPVIPATALLRSDLLTAITDGSRLNWGFVPVVLSLLAYWFLIERTTFGFRLRAVGFNKEAARYAGMKVERSIVSSMAISGAFAGLAGAVITVGTFSFGRALPAHEGYGFDGIAVALVGGNGALGIGLSGLLFGLLKAAQPLMQSQGIPKEIASIIQATIVLFIAMKLGIEHLLARGRSGAAPAPQAEPAGEADG